MQKQSKITSKGQITVPIEVRRLLGVRAGDRLLFESDSNGVHIRPVRNDKESAFAKYAGIGNPGIPSGKKAINRWLREVRGHND
ncbi:MAG: AbrB/MazE/SpoVT family DNA-binding domain-containing protein [Terriglobales bacterium]|jgi:AbrB family looped-hinge helix DNA binding protein